jgi:hypothetical protein
MRRDLVGEVHPLDLGHLESFHAQFLKGRRSPPASGWRNRPWFHSDHMRLRDLIVQIKTFMSVFPHANVRLMPPARSACTCFCCPVWTPGAVG